MARLSEKSDRWKRFPRVPCLAAAIMLAGVPDTSSRSADDLRAFTGMPVRPAFAG
jgi:hypothetical protein